MNIKPCPFCGLDPDQANPRCSLKSKERFLCICCDLCGAEGPFIRLTTDDNNGLSRAMKAWNNRCDKTQ